MGFGRTLGIILSAIFFALLLWFYVRLSLPYEDDVDLPVVVTAPKGYAVANNIPERMHVRVRGAGWQILVMGFTKTSRFRFDLAERTIPQSDQGRLTLRGDELVHSVVIPSEVRVLKVTPDSIEFQFSKRSRKRVPIEPRLDVTASKGYVIIGKPVVTPAFAIVEGASEVIDSLKSIPTKLIVSRNSREDVEQKTEITDSLDNQITVLSPTLVSVHVDVQAVGEQVLHGIPISLEAVPPGREVVLLPSFTDVTIRGGVDELSHVDRSLVHAHVMYDPMLFDTAQSVVPIIEVPSAVTFLLADPPSVKFVVRKVSTQ